MCGVAVGWVGGGEGGIGDGAAGVEFRRVLFRARRVKKYLKSVKQAIVPLVL